MIRVKTMVQSLRTYEVPELMQADFFRALARNDWLVNNYLSDTQHLNEVIVHADRIADRVTANGSEPSVPDETTGRSDGSVKAK
jgi:hypothetical protein